jgi:hypothetical protein
LDVSKLNPKLNTPADCRRIFRKIADDLKDTASLNAFGSMQHLQEILQTKPGLL